MSNSVDDLFNDSPKGPKGFAPLKVGSPAVGGIIFKVERTEKRNMAGEVECYEGSTDPKPQLVTWVITNERDPENPDDDGARRIWWDGNSLYELKNFQKANGFGAPQVGGRIWKKVVGEKPSGKGNPMKLHAAKYEPPQGDWMVQAQEFAAKYSNAVSGGKDDWFGDMPSSVSTPPASSGRTTLDSMRGSFTDEPPF